MKESTHNTCACDDPKFHAQIHALQETTAVINAAAHIQRGAEAKALAARISADIARLRTICVEPMSVKIGVGIDIEVLPTSDDERVLVGRSGWGHTVVNYTTEGLVLDVFAHHDTWPIHTAILGGEDLAASEEAQNSARAVPKVNGCATRA